MLCYQIPFVKKEGVGSIFALIGFFQLLS